MIGDGNESTDRPVRLSRLEGYAALAAAGKPLFTA